ncbi:hypothetical protein AIOL_003632 [Candidatus Rhodobacter oscarellae]|uniref:Uncharacterized protein n=1 Tax=Candidatus Rhodobacter oscarellae TaxID=1675527 RepID=A0A0J9EAH5_9RHOB|nr:hypothetical protein [Candidatus Rhodobacter lobularis]KMW58654.1 hypothetical protein AIOL_003632 [Candidatus Rhodobacter lobularis]
MVDVSDQFLFTPIGFLALIILAPAIWVTKRIILGALNLSFVEQTRALRIAGVFWAAAVLVALWFIFELIVMAFGFIAGGVGGIILAALFCLIVATRAYFSCMTPRMTGLWLRKFHVEPDSDFRLSRMFERLSISDVRMMTLADSRVETSTLSKRQSIYKLLLEVVMYFLFPALMSIVIFLIWFNVAINNSELFARNESIPDWFTSMTLLYILGGILAVYTIIGIFELVRNVLRIRVVGAGRVKLKGQRIFDYLERERRKALAGAQSEYLSGMRILRVLTAEWQQVIARSIQSVDIIFLISPSLRTTWPGN